MLYAKYHDFSYICKAFNQQTNVCEILVQDGYRDILSLTHLDRDKMAAIFQTNFQKDFLEWKSINFDFTEVCSQGSNQYYSSIGSDNCLTPTSEQTIIWTNDV